MSIAGEGRSAPEAIAHALRDDLLDGAIEPGSRLTEESLSERFDSGRHSVRSALQILVAEGLLEHRRNKGIVVPSITGDRIDAMCSYRLILELGALKLALDRGADFAEVSAAVDRLESMGSDASWRHIMEAHSAVHQKIVEASGNERLVTAHRACQNELNCMLAIIRSDFTGERLAVLHRKLLDDLLVGGDTAMRALRDDLELGGRTAMHRALDRHAKPADAAVARRRKEEPAFRPSGSRG